MTSWRGLLVSPWAYPALEVVHIVGIALLLGSLAMVELRVWGGGAELPLRPLARFGLRLTLAGFALAAASGLAMFATQPEDLLASAPFLAKMALLLCAGLNAAVLHARGGVERAPTRIVRAQTLVSIGLWLAIIICGRSIAYY